MKKCAAATEGRALDVVKKCAAATEGRALDVVKKCAAATEGRALDVVRKRAATTEGRALDVVTQGRRDSELCAAAGQFWAGCNGEDAPESATHGNGSREVSCGAAD